MARLLTCASCALAAAFAAAGSARAAVFVIDDRLEDPAPILVFANDWEAGLSINGNLLQQGLNNPASGASPGETLTFDGQWIDVGLSMPLTRTVYFVEPGTTNIVSDILTYTLVGSQGGIGRIFGSFTSDGDPGSLGTVPVGTLPDDIWFEGTDFNWGAPFMTGIVLTDIPAPGSALLLLAGTALAGRRRR